MEQSRPFAGSDIQLHKTANFGNFHFGKKKQLLICISMSQRRVTSAQITSTTQIVREGWLLKKGSKKDKIYGDKWQKRFLKEKRQSLTPLRWCIIKYKEFLKLHELEYYKNPKVFSIKSKITLSRIPIQRVLFHSHLGVP